MDNIFIEGRPATFATAGENQWKEIVQELLVDKVNTSNYIKLNFYIDKSEFYIDGFDVDNLCEPVFQVLTSKLGWFEGKRANIKGFVASKFPVTEIKGLELEQFDCIEENKEQALFDNIYTGPFPNKATDPYIIEWLEQFKYEDNSESYHLRLCFGSEKLSIATISSGKVKPIIDGLYKLIGGKKGAPDDHKIHRLSVQKAVDYLNDNQVRILLYKI